MVKELIRRLRMGTQNVLSLIITTFALLRLVDGAYSCASDQIYQNVTRSCCSPVFNCPPGTGVKFCTKNGTKDICTPCQGNETQPQLVSSLDGINAMCFSNKDQDECNSDDVMPARELSACGIPCVCNYSNCYYGDDPCRCHSKDPESCVFDMTMNKITGECEPCPIYSYKNNIGCGPCYYNETEWLSAHKNGSSTVFPPSPSSYIPKPASTKTTPEAHRTTSRLPESTTLVPFSTDFYTKERSNDSPIPIWLIVVLVVMFVLLILVSIRLAYVEYTRRRNPPHRLLHQIVGSNDQATPTQRNVAFNAETQRLIMRDERPVAPIQPTHHPVQGGYNSVETNGLLENETCDVPAISIKRGEQRALI